VGKGRCDSGANAASGARGSDVAAGSTALHAAASEPLTNGGEASCEQQLDVSRAASAPQRPQTAPTAGTGAGASAAHQAPGDASTATLMILTVHTT
jgi:hypothetical protein